MVGARSSALGLAELPGWCWFAQMPVLPSDLGRNGWAGFVVVEIHRRNLESEPGLLVSPYGVAFGASLKQFVAGFFECLLDVFRARAIHVERDMNLKR